MSGATVLPALHVEVLEGAGPPVLFLPGLGATTRYWAGRVNPLRDRATLVLVDLLGFGRSPKPRVRYSVDRHLAALEPVLRSRETPVIVAHSLGAVLAVALARRDPGSIRGLILLSLPAFEGGHRTTLGFRRGPTPGGWIARNMVLTALTCVFMRRVMGRVLPLVVRDMPRDVVEDLVLHTWRSSTSTIWEVLYRHDVVRDALELPPDLPVHLLHGDRDPSGPLEGATKLAGLRPSWDLHVLPGVRHHPLLEAPDACLEFIGESLTRTWESVR